MASLGAGDDDGQVVVVVEVAQQLRRLLLQLAGGELARREDVHHVSRLKHKHVTLVHKHGRQYTNTSR